MLEPSKRLSVALFIAASTALGSCDQSDSRADQQDAVATQAATAPVLEDVVPTAPDGRYYKDELRRLVQGRTKAQIRELLGGPADVIETADHDVWMYNDIAVDRDSMTGVSSGISFTKDGEAIEVNF